MNDQSKQINFSILILESHILQVKEYRNALSRNSLTMSIRIQVKKISMNTLLVLNFPTPPRIRTIKPFCEEDKNIRDYITPPCIHFVWSHPPNPIEMRLKGPLLLFGCQWYWIMSRPHVVFCTIQFNTYKRAKQTFHNPYDHTEILDRNLTMFSWIHKELKRYELTFP